MCIIRSNSCVYLKGCMFNIKDKEVLVKGAVLAMLADTQAAHSIGGFKVGVGWSLRKCRNCLATKEMMSVQVSKCCLAYNGKVYNTDLIYYCVFVYLQFREEMFVLRNPDAHDYHCSLLTGVLAEVDSVTYGVNYRSALNNLKDFHVCNGQLPQDMMHVLLEGVVPYTMKAMLQNFISEKRFFTIDYVN